MALRCPKSNARRRFACISCCKIAPLETYCRPGSFVELHDVLWEEDYPGVDMDLRYADAGRFSIRGHRSRHYSPKGEGGTRRNLYTGRTPSGRPGQTGTGSLFAPPRVPDAPRLPNNTLDEYIIADVPYKWVDITKVGNDAELVNDDQSVGPFDLGFSLPTTNRRSRRSI